MVELTRDARALLAVQGLRAAAYGLGSVTIGLTLEREGLSGAEVGLVLAAILAGSALASIARLSAPFALDSFGGGFVVQSFLAYWLARKFDASLQLLGAVFFTTGLLQALSF